jgi:hypothetical protein
VERPGIALYSAAIRPSEPPMERFTISLDDRLAEQFDA